MRPPLPSADDSAQFHLGATNPHLLDVDGLVVDTLESNQIINAAAVGGEFSAKCFCKGMAIADFQTLRAFRVEIGVAAEAAEKSGVVQLVEIRCTEALAPAGTQAASRRNLQPPGRTGGQPTAELAVVIPARGQLERLAAEVAVPDAEHAMVVAGFFELRPAPAVRIAGFLGSIESERSRAHGQGQRIRPIQTFPAAAVHAGIGGGVEFFIGLAEAELVLPCRVQCAAEREIPAVVVGLRAALVEFDIAACGDAGKTQVLRAERGTGLQRGVFIAVAVLIRIITPDVVRRGRREAIEGIKTCADGETAFVAGDAGTRI